MDNPPLRAVEDQVLVSPDLPAIRLRVDDRLAYIGDLHFVLYNLAEADIFLFGEAGSNRKLRRWLIVQFEGFLDSNSHTYNYAMPAKVSLGAQEYMHDSFAANLQQMREDEPADSDSAQVTEFLHRQGYTLPDDAIWTRFVRVLGAARRRELLIIYTEDLGELGLTAADLSAGGPLPPEHAALAQGLHERALGAFTILDG